MYADTYARTDDAVARRQLEFAGTDKLRLPRARVAQWARAVVLSFALSGVFAAVFFAVLTTAGWALPFAVVGALFLAPLVACLTAWRTIRFVGVHDRPDRPLRWLIDAYLADADLPDIPDCDEPATVTTHTPVFDNSLPSYATTWRYHDVPARPQIVSPARATRVAIPASRVLARWGGRATPAGDAGHRPPSRVHRFRSLGILPAFRRQLARPSRR